MARPPPDPAGYRHPNRRFAVNADTILAVHLGRHKGVACVHPRAAREYTYQTLDTAPHDVPGGRPQYLPDQCAARPAWTACLPSW